MKCNDNHYGKIDDCNVCWRFRSQNINFAQGASSFGFSSCCAFRLGGIQIPKKKNEKGERKMTIAIEVLAFVIMLIALVLFVFMGYDLVSSCIKKHRYDDQVDTSLYDVGMAKRLFCYLYKHAAEFDVYEFDDIDAYAVIRKECIEKDFDKPIDDEDLQSMDETELKKLRHSQKAFDYKQRNMKKDNADTPTS